MSYLSLLPFLGLVAIVSITGSRFRPEEWYRSLKKPWFTPPGWVFGPVWAIMYVLIAIAGWLVWRGEGISLTLFVWGAQLVLNMAWSWIMFGRRNIGLALIDIGLLWASVALFILLAWPDYPVAAAIFGLYLVWVSFASALNFRIWQLNSAAT